jgi:hypothetical protein
MSNIDKTYKIQIGTDGLRYAVFANSADADDCKIAFGMYQRANFGQFDSYKVWNAYCLDKRVDRHGAGGA